ncbi:MAG: DUF3168 domain-containing protein [Pseudomonadota bacterium]
MQSADLHETISEALATDAQLYTMLGGGRDRVHDRVPSNRKFPFITVDRLQANAWNTDLDDGRDTIATIRVWSRARNRVQSYDIADRIIEIVESLSASATIILAQYVSATHERAVSQNAFLATLRFRLLTEHA